MPLVTEMLAKVYATQTAYSNLLMDFLTQKGIDEDDALKKYNSTYAESYQQILDDLYSRYGDVDLKDLG